MNTSPKKPAPTPQRSPASSQDDQAITLEIAKLPQSKKARLAMQFLGLNNTSLASKHKSATPSSRLEPPLGKIDPKLIEGILTELVYELDQKPVKNPKSNPKGQPPKAKPAPDLRKSDESGMETSRNAAKQPAKIRTLIAKEHPSVAAFVLSSQTTARAAELLQKLHPVRAQKIALALSDLECKRRRFPKKSGYIIHNIFHLA